jgi:DNA-binding response OmpR family regulator
MRVLVVEDEALIALLAAELLAEAGCRVEVAGDAAHGMRLAARTSFDVALVDLGLPDQPGGVLIGWLRRAAAGTAIVVSSGFAPGHARALAEGEAGPGAIAAVLQKPWTERELVEVVRAAGAGAGPGDRCLSPGIPAAG